MDLATDYLGLRLRNPLVASASPLSQTVEGIRRMAGAGIGAVVLYSQFEEHLGDGPILDGQQSAGDGPTDRSEPSI
jgi:dihydroorotate dehydrogenase